jgi:hypothetical protein
MPTSSLNGADERIRRNLRGLAADLEDLTARIKRTVERECQTLAAKVSEVSNELAFGYANLNSRIVNCINALELVEVLAREGGQPKEA